MEKYQIVYYINQFFGQIGGEEKADVGITVKEGPWGPAVGFEQSLNGRVKVVATILCGDNYVNENLDSVTDEIVTRMQAYQPDCVVAGPAYGAGRYGVACGAICSKASARIHCPTVTAMHAENPGVELYHKDTYIVSVNNNARGIKKDLVTMGRLALKLLEGEHADPKADGYFERGLERNVRCSKPAAERMVDMLLAKVRGEAFTTEVQMPHTDEIQKAKSIADLTKARIALATDGGLYPKGNPDKMPIANADRFEAYSVSGLNTLSKGDYEICHNGYDNTYANEDPNRMIPLDALRILEKQGKIGAVHQAFLSTTGLITTVANAKKIAADMVEYIKENNIDGLILTST